MLHNESRLDDTPIVVWSPAAGHSFDLIELTQYLSETKERLSSQLDEHGGVMLRGFNCIHSSDDYQKILDVIAPDLMEYVGGTTPRKVVNGRIMTATEIPGEYSIPLHQEMSYTNNSPDRISFFCEIPAAEGGETTIGDMRAITRMIDDKVRSRFEVHGGLQLCRHLPAGSNGPKTWPEVFGTSVKEEAEKIAQKSGWRLEWRDDGSMQLWQEVRPVTRTHPKSGDEVWFNQVHIFSPVAMLEWARDDGRTEIVERLTQAIAYAPHLLDHTLHGDGTKIEDSDILHIYGVLSANAVPVKWQRGDVLVLDNILIAHGRRPFTGDRRILTGLIQTR